MTNKEEFEKIKNQLPYVLKDGKCYELKFFDVENKCCHFMITNYKEGKYIPAYEDVCDQYNFEFEDAVPTPDKYFIKKVDEASNTNLKRTVSDRTLIQYLSIHKQECVEATDKLKEIIKTNTDKTIRKAAYETCVAIGLDGLDELKVFIDMPEVKKQTGKKKVTNHVDIMDKEKAVVIYLMLVKRYKEHRENINCSVFINTWNELFEKNKYNASKEDKNKLHDKQVSAFSFVKAELDDKTIDEIRAYRDTFAIFPSREVPYELKQLAQSKGVIITLAENVYKHLSGFNILVQENRYMTYKIHKIPYGLSESDARQILQSLPTVSELKDKEKTLIETLNKDSVNMVEKRKAVDKYKAPYATHDFKVFMNRYTLRECKDKQLTNACVNLCKRMGINNLSNEKPIEYKFCVGSGQRKKTMKRAIKIQKAKRKAKKGKGKK